METNREKRSSKFSSGGSDRRRVPPNGMGHAGSGEVIPGGEGEGSGGKGKRASDSPHLMHLWLVVKRR